MIANPPYVVVVTAPESGVGASTLAANLAVYLKAHQEDLPVAFLPLTNNSVGNAMFRISLPSVPPLRNPAHVTAGLGEMFRFGEYGVEYFAPTSDIGWVLSQEWLRKQLAAFDYPGILLIDADSKDPLTRIALRAADLVLVLIAEPASLPAITVLQRELLAGEGSPELLWMIPSQLGTGDDSAPREKLLEFLRFAAQERGFQVLDQLYRADPHIRDKACRLAKPVLTRLPQSELHRQLRRISEMILDQRRQQNSFSSRKKRWLKNGLLPARAGRIDFTCPLCRKPVFGAESRYLEAYPSRHRLLLHQTCLVQLLKGQTVAAFAAESGLLLIWSGAGQEEIPGSLILAQFADDLQLVEKEIISPAAGGWINLVCAATGCLPEELYAEVILISGPHSVADLLTQQYYRNFCRQRHALFDLYRQKIV